MDLDNPVVKLCVLGTQAEFAGRPADARALYWQAWELAGDDFEACVAAHYVARFQPTAEQTLHWNREALKYADAAAAERVKDFYPSLYLNLGRSYEQLGDQAAAQCFYALAQSLGAVGMMQVKMDPQLKKERIQASTPAETLAGAGLFVLWGIVMIGAELPSSWLDRFWPNLLVRAGFYGVLLLAPLGMCIGWIQHFPRWSYPLVVHTLIFSLFMRNAGTPGFLFNGEEWGWRAWLLPAGAALIALLVTRSYRPLVSFFTHIRDDWTLLTFGLFSGMPLLVEIQFDEMEHGFSVRWMVFLALVMVGSVLIYLRSRRAALRIISLLVGTGVTAAVAAFIPPWYWRQAGELFSAQSFVDVLALVGFLLLPAVVGLGLQKSKEK